MARAKTIDNRLRGLLVLLMVSLARYWLQKLQFQKLRFLPNHQAIAINDTAF
jgi:hypothetical protein